MLDFHFFSGIVVNEPAEEKVLLAVPFFSHVGQLFSTDTKQEAQLSLTNCPVLPSGE